MKNVLSQNGFGFAQDGAHLKRKSKLWLFAGFVLMASALVAGYLFLSGGRAYSTDLGGLRAQFNRDKGKVRLLMVLSPT